jgi:transcriptional regulator with XRE-family HTH domain
MTIEYCERLRKQKHLTVKQAADLLYVSDTAWYGWVNKKYKMPIKWAVLWVAKVNGFNPDIPERITSQVIDDVLLACSISRGDKRLSKSKAAKLIGISLSTILSWQAGRRSSERARVWLEYYVLFSSQQSMSRFVVAALQE